MHVVLMNQFYPPGRAPTGVLLQDLALALQERGHTVRVVTSAGMYGGKVDDAASTDGPVEVIRVGRASRHRTSLLGKMVQYVGFFPRAYRALVRLHPRPDLVVCMTTPPFCGLIPLIYYRRHGVPYVMWCMDLFPEALVAGGLLRCGGVLHRLLSRVGRAELSASALLVSLAPDMSERLQACGGERILEVPVWSGVRVVAADVEQARALRIARGWHADEVVLMYSGNMGRAHSVDAFLALAEQLREKQARVRIVFCGEGPAKREWMARSGNLFEWLEPVAASQLTAHLLSADVHLVSQRPEWTGVVVPSKYQAACALGRPVLFAGPVDSAVAKWIYESGQGWVLSSSAGGGVLQVSDYLVQYKRIGSCDPGVTDSRFQRCSLTRLLVDGIEAARGAGEPDESGVTSREL